MTRIEELLTEATQALADLVSVAEANATGQQAAAIEQALADVVGALEKSTKTDFGAIVDAIKGLSLTVAPPQVQVNVSPTPITVVGPDPRAPDTFRPLTLKVNRNSANGLIDTIDITERLA